MSALITTACLCVPVVAGGGVPCVPAVDAAQEPSVTVAVVDTDLARRVAEGVLVTWVIKREPIGDISISSTIESSTWSQLNFWITQKFNLEVELFYYPKVQPIGFFL